MSKKWFLVELEGDTGKIDEAEIYAALVMGLEGVSNKVEAVEQPLALDDAHVCGWCKGKQNLVWSCPVCDVG